jgi:Uma2 family endonuclease
MSTVPQIRFTFEEYLAWEEQQLDKHEYFQGEVFSMAGTTFDHIKIIANLHRFIGNQSSLTGCNSVGPDLKVICPTGLCTYPDVVVYFENPVFAESKKLVIENPKIIFEVLSPSTMSYDRGDKFLNYQSIPSLRHYCLVSQNRSLVEVFSRQERDDWKYTPYQEGRFELSGSSRAALSLELAEIYQGIEFPDLKLLRDTDAPE